MMTPLERRSLAEQITTNPLFKEIIGDLEASAIERMISAADDETRLTAQLRVQAIRSLRSDLDECLSTRERRGAPA